MYTILIQIDGIEKRRRSATLSHLIVGLFLMLKAADYYHMLNYGHFLPTLPFYIAAVASILYGFFRRRFDVSARHNQSLRFLQFISFAVLGFLMMKNGRTFDYIGCFIWAAFCLLLLISERKVFNDSNLVIDKNGVTVPGYYNDHHIDWDQLSEMVVRQDYVTIFHKNNKYLQFQVLQSLSDLEIAQINGFCKEQMDVTKRNNININANLN